MSHPSLSPIQHLAIRYLATGESAEKVARRLKLGPGHVKKWLKTDEGFNAELQRATADHASVVEAMLIAGEREAAETLMQALRAEARGGVPNWNVRLNAALSLLDRAGQRGRAIEKQQIAQVVARAQPDVEEALRRALKDPGVKSWLKGVDGFAKLLPSGEDTTDGVETVEVEVDLDPTNPDSAPLMLMDPSKEEVA